MKYFFALLFVITNISINAKTVDNSFGAGTGTKPTIHVISIGINEYENFNYLKYAVSDSKAIIQKIKNDSINESKDLSKHRGDKWNLSIKTYILNNKDASLSAIKNALKEVIKNAKSYDSFVFFFGGVTFENSITNDTFLAPYKTNLKAPNENECLSLKELSQFLEQIQCKNQLIISEAGNGKIFAQNLISQLFESNSIISANTDRNRIIITTKGLGFEKEEMNGGPLVYYLINSEDKILDVFSNIDHFEFNLIKAEIKSPLKTDMKERYSVIYSEREYKKILLNSPVSRGSKGTAIVKEDSKTEKSNPKTYALLIASNDYISTNEWNTLKNPINDSEAVAKILEKKYNAITTKLYNESKENILEEIVRIKKLIHENDKFIFFIAGHGYFSENLSDGFLVMKESKPISNDIGLESYLPMATLNRMLDNMPSKNVFAIFDVCFGASFDLLAKDLALNDFKNTEKDISLDELIERKNEKCSRIYLASGRYEVPDYWKNSLTHSPFADKLIKTLENQKDFISPGILFSALEGNATEPFLKQFGKHDERGDFLLKVVN